MATATVIASAAMTVPGIGVAQASTTLFTYTGAQQDFVVPAGITSVYAVVIGGSGGDGASNGGAGGGATQVTTQQAIAVTPGETLRLTVGGAGASGTSGGAGGYGGSPGGDGTLGSGGGGGSSYIEQSDGIIVRAIISAGGGGGGGRGFGSAAGGDGGSGGAPIGRAGGNAGGNGGGRGSGPVAINGAGGVSGSGGQDGHAGLITGGGDGSAIGGGGGAGGYFSGGGGGSAKSGTASAGGGGGSSYSEATTGISMRTAASRGNGSIRLTWYSNAAPSLAGIRPDAGSVGGGTRVRISGSGFISGATASIGGSPCTVTSLTATVIRCTTGSHSLGTADVVVSNPDSPSASLSGAFTYTARAKQFPINCVTPPPAGVLKLAAAYRLMLPQCITNAHQRVGVKVTVTHPVGRGDVRPVRLALHCRNALGTKTSTISTGYGDGTRMCARGSLMISTGSIATGVILEWSAPRTTAFERYQARRTYAIR